MKYPCTNDCIIIDIDNEAITDLELAEGVILSLLEAAKTVAKEHNSKDVLAYKCVSILMDEIERDLE